MELGEIRRILVPTDFSETADEALGVALGLARAFGATVELVHVAANALTVLPPPLELVAFGALFPDLTQKVEANLQARADRFVAADVACEFAVLEGNAHGEIVRYAAERSVDMIVMATHGRSGVGHAVMGSVAERVLHRAGCPVLMIPVHRKR